MDNILSISYLIVWILTFVWYHYRYHTLDGGTAIIGSYIIWAFISILTLNDPFFAIMYEPLKVFPYIYLYMMLMMALSPTIYHHFHPTSGIEVTPTRIYTFTAIVIIVCAILQIPEIISNLGTGFMKLFTDPDAGKDAYLDMSIDTEDAGSVISNIPSIIYNSLADLSVFLFFFFVATKRSWKITIPLGFSTIISFLLPVFKGQRSGVIMSLFTFIVCYMLFRRYLSKRVNRYVRIAGITVAIGALLPVAAITLSRFDTRATGVTGFVTWYAGQSSLYFNNYGLEAGGTRNGDRTFNLVKRLIWSDTPKNYTERRDKYHNLEIDDYYFTTFVGDFTIDFGPYIAVIIFVVFNAFILWKIRTNDDTIHDHQLLLLFLTQCITMQGGMYLFNYADTAGLQLLTNIMLYTYLVYHEKLSKVFPAETNRTEVQES